MKRNLSEQVLKPDGAPDWAGTLFVLSLTHSRSVIHSLITIGPYSSVYGAGTMQTLQMLRLLGPEELVKWIIFLNQKNHFHPLDLYRTKLCSQSKDQNGT